MKKILIFLSIFSLFFIFSIHVQAHVLKTDDNIGGVLHIDPEDDPVAGEQATFFFEMKDKTNKFSAADCNCRVDVYENKNLIYSDAVTQGNSPSSSVLFAYTFPQKDVYLVKLVGNPQTENSFQPFTLTYDILVARESNSAKKTSVSVSHYLIFIPIGAIFLFLLLVTFRKKSKTRI